MSYQTIAVRKNTWRANMPVSCATCMRFDTLREAERHACYTSKQETEIRHVIHTGDYFFSSTTAIIFWYEKLIITYRNGQVIENYITEKYIEL